jgi:hypothetical protein
MHEDSVTEKTKTGKAVNISGVTGNPTDRVEYDTIKEAVAAAKERSHKVQGGIVGDMLRTGFPTSEEHFDR